MTSRLLLTALCIAGSICFSSGGTASASDEVAEQALKVSWDVPTNIWPIGKIWVYRAIPQTFFCGDNLKTRCLLVLLEPKIKSN